MRLLQRNMGTRGINLDICLSRISWLKIHSVSVKKAEKTTFDREPCKEAVALPKLEFYFCNWPTPLCNESDY